ncbi:hypothetical protein J2857_001950 [Neorhizobium galegae]|nr:hypothetical protein [Neorhizobium galegae]
MISKPYNSFVITGHLSHRSEVLSMSYHQNIRVYRRK